MGYTYIPTIQHSIYDDKGKLAHTVRHASTQYCRYCKLIEPVDVRPKTVVNDL